MRRDAGSDYCVKFSGGLCGIQQKYGEDFLGEACYFYPRITRSLGSRTVMTAALSCPEIARLALFDEDSLAFSDMEANRLPASLKDYLPEKLTPGQALHIHKLFLNKALESSVPAERTLMRIFTVAESLERISAHSWPDAVPFYFEHADSGLPRPESLETDPVFLLQALCGLIFAAKKVNNERLMQCIAEIEQALHVKIRMDTLAIIPMPDTMHCSMELARKWKEEFQAQFAPVLSRYLAMQLSMALFPFGGFGGSLTERTAIIGVRLATIKLALMSACAIQGKMPSQDVIIRIIQGISRFLDHLAEADFSVKIYQETGWLKKSRLRALLGDS